MSLRRSARQGRFRLALILVVLVAITSFANFVVYLGRPGSWPLNVFNVVLLIFFGLGLVFGQRWGRWGTAAHCVVTFVLAMIWFSASFANEETSSLIFGPIPQVTLVALMGVTGFSAGFIVFAHSANCYFSACQQRKTVSR